MNKNPLAKVIRDAFINNVARRPEIHNPILGQNTIANILRNKRITRFEAAINQFLTSCGEKNVPSVRQFADEKNLLTFSLMLSGYIRDAQKALSDLKNIHATDADLIKLYQAAAKYSADCSGMIENNKYTFQEHCDYKFWKLNLAGTLAKATFKNSGFAVSPKRRALILAMPFHIKDTQEELQKWTSKYLGTALDIPSIFGSQVDVYLAHFPIEQPRGEKFALSLQTISAPETFFTREDMNFVKHNLSSFLGEGIAIDGKNNITNGKAYDKQTFINNCKNITIVGYCAGVAHAHRWINAFSHLSSQLYDSETCKQALSQIFICSYAFLPVQEKLKYSGAHFMSNYSNDNGRKEPFIKMFNPELYEKAKYRTSPAPAYITLLPDKRNSIIAFNLPENVKILTPERKIETPPDIENGHHMGLVTQYNLASLENHPANIFRTVLQNASLGKRGKEVYEPNRTHSQKQYIALLNKKILTGGR